MAETKVKSIMTLQVQTDPASDKLNSYQQTINPAADSQQFATFAAAYKKLLAHPAKHTYRTDKTEVTD